MNYQAANVSVSASQGFSLDTLSSTNFQEKQRYQLLHWCQSQWTEMQRGSKHVDFGERSSSYFPLAGKTPSFSPAVTVLLLVLAVFFCQTGSYESQVLIILCSFTLFHFKHSYSIHCVCKKMISTSLKHKTGLQAGFKIGKTQKYHIINTQFAVEHQSVRLDNVWVTWCMENRSSLAGTQTVVCVIRPIVYWVCVTPASALLE